MPVIFAQKRVRCPQLLGILAGLCDRATTAAVCCCCRRKTLVRFEKSNKSADPGAEPSTFRLPGPIFLAFFFVAGRKTSGNYFKAALGNAPFFGIL